MRSITSFILPLVVILSARPAAAADLKILLPLGRTAYQTNEWIDISVVRSNAQVLGDASLVLTLTGEDGSKLDFTFPTGLALGQPSLSTENYHINGSLLRPGVYTVNATQNGAAAPPVKLEVYSHLRKSTFKLIDWGSRAAGPDEAVLGEDSVGINLDLPSTTPFSPDDLIRAGVDYMWCCSMSGGSQMDLRRECDWSDPYVLGGGVARVSRRAFMDRTNPNCLGVHIYDEPTLTTWKDTATGETTPFNVPAQDRSYKAAFGEEPLQYNQVHPDNPKDVDRWFGMQRWRMTLLDAAWKFSDAAIRAGSSDFLSANQGDWLFSGYGAGYYFNYMNSLPVYSGHGGYDYLNGGDFAPGYFFEFGRIRQTDKPNWYLPMWGSGHPDLFRAEQYLSFQNNLQGIDKPPDLLLHRPSTTPVSSAMVESNKAMARLGTIFTTMPVTPPDVAVLFSLSHNLNAELHDMKDTYVGGDQFNKLLYVYLAGKILHVPFFPVVEEDILDGSVSAHHRVLLIAGNNYLPPTVVDALQAFIAGGGVVLLSDDSKVHIPGARPFHFPQSGVELNKNMELWGGSKQWDKWNNAVVSSFFFKTAGETAEALRPVLKAAGAAPVFDCDQPGIIASRQAQGDIEYLFAVNATPDYNTFGWYFLHNTAATIHLPDDGRSLYDAMNGGLLSFRKGQGDRQALFRFGPGQMRVFARTARPIGGVEIFTPLVQTDMTAARDPIHVDVGAVLVDMQKGVICGAAPLRIQLIDPLGSTRYDLYRATDRGMLRLSLPLAVNDPPGAWTVEVRELLNNTTARATFHYTPPAQPGGMAGATRRAVYFGPDWENIFQFFRNHHDVAIVPGTTPDETTQAQRLVEILKPWDIHADIVTAAEASKPRPLTPEMASSWVGSGGREPDFALSRPAILLGTPEDNPLIKFLRDQHYLPYQPVQDQFPGRARGMMAWQQNGIHYFNAESITLIGYDPAGLAEAVGTMYQAMAAQSPITPLALPSKASSAPAVGSPARLTILQSAWDVALPDRPIAMKTLTDGGVLVLTDDGTLSRLSGTGKLVWQKTFDGGENWALDTTPDGSLIVLGNSHNVLLLEGTGATRSTFPLSRDAVAPWVTFVAISPDGKKVAAGGGFSDWRDPAGWKWHGTLIMVSSSGKLLWQINEPGNGEASLPAEALSAGMFTDDSTKLVLPLSKEIRILDAASGKLLATLEGGTNAAPALRTPQGLLFTDGSAKTVRYPSTAGWSVDLPSGLKVVSLASGKGSLLVGTEGDGAVRQLAAGPGAKTTWTYALPTRIVKQIVPAGDLIAVAYWGGTLRVLDSAGSPRYGQAFSQDIAQLGWAAGKLVVALADGRVEALSLPNAPHA